MLISLTCSFFTHFQPLCPILEVGHGHNHYFTVSPLLAWTIVYTAARHRTSESSLLERLSAPLQKLLWSTIADMPQKYHTVKALILLCNWPVVKQYAVSKVPNDDVPPAPGLGLSEVDPTYMLSGIMMQVALQTGLHRFSRSSDFVRMGRNTSAEELRHKHFTWTMCNIVAHKWIYRSSLKTHSDIL